MDFLVPLLLSGIAMGAIYGLVALGFVLLINAVNIINIAQGEFLMLGSFFIFTFTVMWGLPLPVALLLMLVASAVVGVLFERVAYRPLKGGDIADEVRSGGKIIVDTRHHSEVHDGTVEGAVNVPGIDKAASYIAWVFDPESDTADLVVLAEDQEKAEDFRNHFIRVGVDETVGYVTSFEGLPTTSPEVLAQDKLEGFSYDMLLDLRNKTEHADGHIPGSVQLSGGRVLWNLDQLPDADATIVTYCQSGVRNSVAGSALRRKGYNIVELEDSYLGWLDHTNK